MAYDVIQAAIDQAKGCEYKPSIITYIVSKTGKIKIVKVKIKPKRSEI